MPVEEGCSEWALPIDGAGTVLALAKHTEPGLNSTVPTAQPPLVKCGVNGGQMGVVHNATDPAYNTAEYKNSKARPKGIIIKLVRAPSS
ncbi:hypothetical protein B0H66DRAFT_603363 [Apodospora peruviana]|uniref:Uncharacterized protein n=1 Tax=Apodospora peruviana TaxID=516989 RepID=A0AAE0M4V5_9PEZI|nr:hypothetical protein B0H66DRAFT_603363 [Apodospora peruviana]